MNNAFSWVLVGANIVFAFVTFCEGRNRDALIHGAIGGGLAAILILQATIP